MVRKYSAQEKISQIPYSHLLLQDYFRLEALCIAIPYHNVVCAVPTNLEYVCVAKKKECVSLNSEIERSNIPGTQTLAHDHCYIEYPGRVMSIPNYMQ